MVDVARQIYFESVKALERRAAGAHLLNRFARAAGPRERVAGEMLEKILEIVGAEAGALALADEAAGRFEFVALRWAGASAPDAAQREKALKLFQIKLTEGVLGQVHQSGEPVALPDVARSSAFRKDMAEAARYEVRNLLAVPVRTEEARLGVLELFNKTPKGTFSASDMELAAALGAQASLVLDNHARNGTPAAAAAAPPSDLQETRRAARDAQSQLVETRKLLDTALEVQEQNARRIKELTADVERFRTAAEAATPPQQMARLLRSIEPIAFTLSLETVLRNVGELVARLVNAQAVQIFLWQDREERFNLVHSTAPGGLGKGVVLSFKKGEGLAGWAGDRTEIVQAADVTRDDRFSKSIDEVPGVLSRSLLAAPLAADGRLVGVIEAINRKDGQPFSEDDVSGFGGLSLMGAAAIDKALLHDRSMQAARSLLMAVMDLAESRSVTEGGRAERRRQMALALAEALGFKEADLRALDWAVLVYGAGKILAPADLLKGEAELGGKERELMGNVPRASADILNPYPILVEIARLVRHVNERWDGMGRPDRLSGEAIPLGSRVIAVVDLYEGLLTGTGSRKPLPPDVAAKEVESCAGKLFDPACVEAFLRLHRSNRLLRSRSR